MKHTMGNINGTPDPSLPSRGAWIETILCLRVFSLVSRRSLHGERGLKLDEDDGKTAETGRSLHGERGLKHDHKCDQTGSGPGRSLHGERGLKRVRGPGQSNRQGSLPSRGAWIETAAGAVGRSDRDGRSLHGERGLKPGGLAPAIIAQVVAPFTGSVD